MLELLEKSLKLAEQISVQIEQQDWPAVEQLQAQQQTLLSQLAQMETPTSTEEVQKANQLTTAIQSLNKTQIAASKIYKDQLFEKIKKNNASNKMKNAYKS